MPQRNVRKPFVLLFLLLAASTIFISAIPLTDPVLILNNTITSTAPAPNKGLIFQNVTSPGTSPNMFDYRIVGTPLLLRITETGHPFTQIAVHDVIDKAIRQVVTKINTGSGKASIDYGSFSQLSYDIDLRIKAIQDTGFTYFLLGDVLAGVWQYMNEPWSSFREIVFDVVLFGQRWDYIGYGRLTKIAPDTPPPETSSSLSPNANLVLNAIE